MAAKDPKKGDIGSKEILKRGEIGSKRYLKRWLWQQRILKRGESDSKEILKKARSAKISHGHDNRISLNILIRICFNRVEFIYFSEARSTSIYLRHTGPIY